VDRRGCGRCRVVSDVLNRGKYHDGVPELLTRM
jgi:hypothetical protein